ncbi:MAG: winged helix DNA-binding domain-containing protein [Actinomycetota bacterium]|nr:winged helix DNA-binding domain-containing protein [Actinomycetota bacterium]
MTAAPAVSRDQVLAYRARAQGLDGAHGATDPAALAIFDLGVQDSPAGTAAHSVAVRLAERPSDPDDLRDGRRWLTTWAIRGAPHVFRVGDVRAMACATWPGDAADAAARLAGYGGGLRKRDEDALDALRTAAEGMRRVVTDTMAKGDASRAATEALPGLCAEPCRSCGTTHISDQLMRLATLPAGLALDPDAAPVTLRPIPGWAGVPDHQEGARDLVRAYLALHGPATAKEVAAYLQTTQAPVKAVWPDDLAEVTVDGRRAWLPEEHLDDLVDAPAPELVRLLPRSDPWLMARDRELLVPDAAHRKAMWPTLGFPSAVLVNGEVAGTWRTKATARRLDVNVSLFTPITSATGQRIEEEAGLVARLRGLPDVRVRIDA